MGTKDITLYAVWVSEDCWLVTFDPQGGSEVISQQILKGNKPVVPAVPTKAGYVFDGWYKEPQCKNIWDFERNEVTGNIIIYANWKLKENTLVFNGNAADITGTMEDMKLAPGNRAALPSNVFARTGYTFAGWAASADGEVIYLDGAGYTMGEEESYTLYAVWVDNTRWLATFNSQGGSAVEEQRVTRGVRLAQPQNPVMAGYTFGGWYKESGCVNAWNFQTEVIGGNIMLYAKWIPNNNILNFDKNAGDATGTMNAQNIATNSTIALPLNAFVRAGYIFTGWAASQNGEVIYTNGADYNMGAQASYTLYAVWRANNNNIVFNKNDAAATGTMNKQTAATGEIINLSAVGFVKIGYTFAGWAETPAGKAAY